MLNLHHRSCSVPRLLSTILGLALSLSALPAASQDNAAAPGRLYDVHGTKLYIETFGSGTPILFLHGGVHFFDNSFPEQQKYFSTFRKVVGIDQRGHGHSPDNDRPFSYREMADDTAAVIALLGIGPVDVVGHSDGGDVALLLARYHPETVRRMVISGANLRGLPADEYARRKLWSPQQVADSVRHLEAQLPSSFRIDYQAVTPDGPAHWQTHLTKSYHLWATPVVIDPGELRAVSVPVLVMAGDHDFSSVEETTELFRALPRSQLFIVPNSGHGTFSERPALVNLAIREFLEQPDKIP
jgi:pimeloyl-ACP methyl ester carboxylesterase